MTTINEITERMAAWLRGQEFDPALRIVSTVELKPPAAYPHLVVLVEREDFGPGDGDVTASLRLRVYHAGGRPAEAQRQLRTLIHQLRVRLNHSHGLGGMVKRLHLGAISYGGGAEPEANEPPVLHADLALILKYCVTVLDI